MIKKKTIAPDWFSLGAINLEEIEDRKKAIELYQGLVDDISLRKPWSALDKRYPKVRERYKNFPHHLFLNLYNHGVVGPGEFLTMPVSEITVLGDRIETTVKTLLELVHKTKTDFPLSDPFNGSANKKSPVDLMFSSLVKGWKDLVLVRIGYERKYLNRPDRGMVKVRYFSWRMTNFFNAVFGTPLHDVTAAFATHIFNEVIDADYVKKSVKMRKSTQGRNLKKR